MEPNGIIKRTAIIFMAIVPILFFSGCEDSSNGEPVELDPGVNGNGMPDEITSEDPLAATTYYLPWISNAEIVLSGGEVIIGLDVFESDPGYAFQFSPDYSYQGRLVWLVDHTAVFDLEWVTLAFDVDYYVENEWQTNLLFDIALENLEPHPGEDNIWRKRLDLAETKQDFAFSVKEIIVAKDQESRFATEPIDYVALEVEITVLPEE